MLKLLTSPDGIMVAHVFGFGGLALLIFWQNIKLRRLQVLMLDYVSKVAMLKDKVTAMEEEAARHALIIAQLEHDATMGIITIQRNKKESQLILN